MVINGIFGVITKMSYEFEFNRVLSHCQSGTIHVRIDGLKPATLEILTPKSATIMSFRRRAVHT